MFPNVETLYEYLQQKEYNPLEEKKSWHEWIKKEVSSKYQYFRPDMPNSKMANYPARKIWFEKLFPYLDEEGVILIGHSL